MKKVYLWGRGNYYRLFSTYATFRKDVEMAGIIQTKPDADTLAVSDLLKEQGEWYVIITNVNYDECLEACEKIGIDCNRVIIPYLYPGFMNRYECIRRLDEFVECAEAIVDVLTWNLKYSEIIGPMTYDNMEYTLFNDIETWTKEEFGVLQYDYARIRTLELLIEEIKRKKLQGSMAEVGVFQGSFAKIMSHYMKEKKLFLYDTFEGFVKKDYCVEIEQNNFTTNFMSVFKNTNVENVKKYIGNLDNCYYRVGYFPDTIEEMDKNEKFCLVSLDADMYNPTLAGLEFFYPRLEKGGYILIHEYNCRALDYAHKTMEIQRFDGIKKAVYEFEKRYGEVCLVPITDRNGTLIITK